MAKYRRKHEDIMHIYEESFKREKVEYKKDFIDKFTISLGITGKTIMWIVIILYMLVIIGVFLSFENINQQMNQDVGKYLKKQYNCNFVIIEKDIDEKGNGTYVAYNKKNKDIVFQIEKNKTKITDTYMTEVIRYYLENEMTEYNLNEYNITRENQKAVCFNMYSLDELDKIIEFIYQLNKKTMKELKGYSNVTGYVMVRYNDYFHYPYIGTDRTVQEIVNSIENDYNKK